VLLIVGHVHTHFSGVILSTNFAGVHYAHTMQFTFCGALSSKFQCRRASAARRNSSMYQAANELTVPYSTELRNGAVVRVATALKKVPEAIVPLKDQM